MLKPLTSLRFAAALLVFFWHCPITRGYAMVFSTGYAGVSFFFLLSGFILTYTYHGKFETTLTKREISAFYQARFARIYPLLFVSTLFMITVLLLFGGPHWTALAVWARLTGIFAQVTLIQSWFPVQKLHFGVNGPAWSISDEAFFYALFPFVAWLLFRALRHASVLVVLSLGFALWAVLTVVLLSYRAGPDDWLAYVFPPARLVDFIEGMIIGIAFLKAAEKRTAWRYPTAWELSVLLILILAIGWSPMLPQSLRFSAAFMPIFGALIYLFAHQTGELSRLVSSRICVRLGEISFAFYMVHLGVILAYGSIVGWSNPLRDFIAAFGLTLGLAYLLFTFVEKPLREYIRGGFASGWQLRATSPLPPVLPQPQALRSRG